MLKKTITYMDYNGTERTEDFYFNLTQAEVMEMEMSVNGGIAEMIQRVVAAKDGATIINIFKDVIKRSYGKKSLDGRKFEKSEEIWSEFERTEAYSILFMELATNADEAAKFIEGIIPSTPKSPEISAVN